jgi:hypothetical protein
MYSGATPATKTGTAVKIDVDGDGNAWNVTKTNKLKKWNGSSFDDIGTDVKDVGVNSGAVYVAKVDGTGKF